MYRRRFNLRNHPLPKDARGDTFFTDTDGYDRLVRAFETLNEDCGLGVLTGMAGTGKTAAIRELCNRLPKPDHRVFYLCDTAVAPLDLYRMLAIELGVAPSHRRSQLWADIKQALAHLVDEQGVVPIIVIDEAQHLSDRFLIDLSGFLNFAFDSRDLFPMWLDEQGVVPIIVIDEAQHLSDRFLIDLSGFPNFAFDSRDLFPMWLVGMPPLLGRLRMQQHAALAMRVACHVHLDALGHDELLALVRHGLDAAGATDKLISDPAMEMLYRTSRGIPRVASKLLRAALREAHHKDQRFVDERVLEAAIEQIGIAVEAAS